MVTEGWGKPLRLNRKGANEYIPTWQVGTSQSPDNDYGAYAKAGYGQNSIIFACVRERATSFADLPLTLVRDEDELESDALELMRAPSGEMDGFEFAETLITQLDIAGNVYIEKIRKTTAFPDRRSWPVKELGLIRPDYVEIIPGTTRENDVFVVKVNGQERKRLARKDVIHIRTPNPSNDFYGLSPIAVLAREADLDKLMTDFDLSFFRNAGVPMGLLKTKTRHSPDEVNEIKGAFKRSFSGLKKWFEILVLNSEEAEFQQLGGMPHEMEMTNTRDFAEARACAVYGVPPVMVGVLVGLKNSPWSNYENAQFSFWSETMRPLARSVSSALTRELLPEFQTSALRGARLEYDFSGVQALQEDNSDRLKVVAQLTASGGFTVNEALERVGLQAVDNGDFYVRNLTQVIDVALPAASRQRIDAVTEQPARALPTEDGEVEASVTIRGETKQADTRAARDRLRERAVDDLADFFEEQAERVVSRLGKSLKAREDDLVPTSEDDLLENAVRPHYAAAAESGWEIAAAEIGVSPEFNPADPRVIELLQGAGDRVGDINDATREEIRKALSIARDEGLSIQQTADMLRDLPGFSESRAEKVARTELAIADNKGAIERYKESGLVDEVDIIDGPDCGFTSHDDPDKAHGTRRTLEEFEEHVIAHPNCVRSRSPVIREG